MQKKLVFTGFAVLIFLASIFLVIAAGFSADIIEVEFKSDNLFIKSGERMTRDDVLRLTKINKGTNVLFLNARDAENKITLEEPMALVEIERIFPRQIKITLEERVRAFIIDVEGHHPQKAILDLNLNFVRFIPNPVENFPESEMVTITNYTFKPSGRELSFFLGKNISQFTSDREFDILKNLLQNFANVGRTNAQFLSEFDKINIDLTNKKINIEAVGRYNIELFSFDVLFQKKVQRVEALIGQHKGFHANEGILPQMILRVWTNTAGVDAEGRCECVRCRTP